MESIKTFGAMEDPCEAGRFTAWMDPSDICLGLWFRHFEAKGIACGIYARSNGKRAVFRTLVGMIDPQKSAAKAA